MIVVCVAPGGCHVLVRFVCIWWFRILVACRHVDAIGLARAVWRTGATKVLYSLCWFVVRIGWWHPCRAHAQRIAGHHADLAAAMCTHLVSAMVRSTASRACPRGPSPCEGYGAPAAHPGPLPGATPHVALPGQHWLVDRSSDVLALACRFGLICYSAR